MDHENYLGTTLLGLCEAWELKDKLTECSEKHSSLTFYHLFLHILFWSFYSYLYLGNLWSNPICFLPLSVSCLLEIDTLWKLTRRMRRQTLMATQFLINVCLIEFQPNIWASPSLSVENWRFSRKAPLRLIYFVSGYSLLRFFKVKCVTLINNNKNTVKHNYIALYTVHN